MNFNEKLIQLRKEKHLNQEQLADCLCVSRQAISKWECGESYPDTEKLIAIAKFFDVSLDQLVFDKYSNSVNENNSTYYDILTENEKKYKEKEKKNKITKILLVCIIAIMIVPITVLSILVVNYSNTINSNVETTPVILSSNINQKASKSSDTSSNLSISVTFNYCEESSVNFIAVDSLGNSHKYTAINSGNYTYKCNFDVRLYETYSFFVEINDQLIFVKKITIDSVTSHSY